MIRDPSYNVIHLIRYCEKNLKPIRLKLTDITGLKRSKSSGFSQRRYDNADIKYPIIVDEYKDIIDGRHRTLKAIDSNRKYLQAYILHSNIISKKIKPMNDTIF